MKTTIFSRAVRLYGRSILTTVMGGFMYISVGIITHAVTPNINGQTLSAGAAFFMNLIALLIQAFLFGSIIYAETWEQGDKAGAEHLLNHVAGNPHFGLKLGLLADIPAMLSFVVLVAEKLFGFWPQYTMVYRAAHLALYPIVAWTMGTQWNVPAADISWGGIFGSLIVVFAMPAVAWLCYYLGYRQINLGRKAMYKNKKK